MDDRLEISDRVRAYLAPEDLAALARARRHSELTCFVCEKPILPESEEKATVSLLSDPVEGILVARVAHPDCAPSQAEVLDMPREALAAAGSSGTISYIQAVMRLPNPTAAVFWEQGLAVTARGGEGEGMYPYLEGYREDGFAPGERIPFLDRWEFGFEGNDLVLRRGDETMERFGDAVENAPDAWFDAIRSTGSCLALVGVGLGVSRFDLGQLEKARIEGRAVAAMIGVSGVSDGLGGV